MKIKEVWNKIPNWIKGGIITDIIFIVLIYLLSNLYGPSSFGMTGSGSRGFPASAFLYIPVYLIAFIFDLFGLYLPSWSYFWFSLTIYFLLGALIGRMFDKISSKK